MSVVVKVNIQVSFSNNDPWGGAYWVGWQILVGVLPQRTLTMVHPVTEHAVFYLDHA